MKLLKVDSLDIAIKRLYSVLYPLACTSEIVTLEKAVGRILAEDIYVRENIPAFFRSTVDGYAVVSGDTAAAGESIPVILECVGEVEMGKTADMRIKSGQCVAVPTGGMLPSGADAAIMVEYSEIFSNNEVLLQKPVAAGENVIQPGEDIENGNQILAKGTELLAGEIGALATAGVVNVPVFCQLRMAIISTGDELIPPEKEPKLGQIRDINTYALQALAAKRGFSTLRTAVLKDNEQALVEEIEKAKKDCDIVVVSGGSSQGEKDITCDVIDKTAQPGVFTHGLAVKPGKPTILGYDKDSNTILVGLPGHPVSAMMVFEAVICNTYKKATGWRPKPAIPAFLSVNVAASPGKTTFYPVQLEAGQQGYKAIPVFGKSGLITTLTKADGYFEIGRDQEGLPAGAPIFVHLF